MMSSKIFSSSTLAKLILGSVVTSTSSAFKKSASPKLLEFVTKSSRSSSCHPFDNLIPLSSRGFHSTAYNLKSELPEVDPKWAENPKLIPNEEWAKRLNPEQYFCTREGGTEPPFSGQYLNHKAEGIYTCVCCGSDLFSSKTKYDSGSGWPSFNAALGDTSDAPGSVIRRKDISHGMVRNEIICKTCNAHLGHVFEDGPEPTGQRHCVNSAALKFVPKKL